MKITAVPNSTLEFLEELKENNHRPWFQENKERFQTEYNQFKALAEELKDLMTHHDEIEQVKVFRIYRDVRFSKNKSPYKNHLSGHLKRATKWRRGGYYFHIEPGNSFLGGGFWGPNSEDLKRIRQEIAQDAKPLRKIINSASFKKHFGELAGDQVKTAPKGYAKDHPNIDLLRYKQYLLYRSFTDEEVTSKGFVKELNKYFKAMRPFLDYMSEVLTTDANGVPIE